MRSLAKLVIMLLLFSPDFCAAEVNTELLQLDPVGVAPEKLPALQELISRANGAIPERMKQAFDKPILVNFGERLGNDKNATLEIDCSAKHSAGTKVGFVKQGDTDHLFIDQRLIPEVEKGLAGSRKIDCGHGSYYNTVLATVIHEVSHLYDDHRKVSKRESYRMATGWDASGSLKNFLTKRSPDAYETYDPYESFAVNMEYFLLDPEYRCRRPTAWKVLAEEFQTQQSAVDCSKFQSAFADGERIPITLDPKRIYQIQYFLAAPRSQSMSKWGHAMLRLIICDPKRTEVGPDCAKDVSNHIVVSYLANIDDVKLSSWKGITGKYPSQLSFRRLNSVLGEYGRDELRDLKGFPLNLNDQQKENLVHYLLEQFWGYQGKYYFLTNNCATETLNAVKMAFIDEKSPEDLNEKAAIVTPIDLQNVLERSGLLNSSDIKDQKAAIEKGYLFPSSQRDDLKRAFQAARNLIPARYATVDEYLDKSDPEERAKLIENSAEELKTKPSLAVSLFILELQCDRINSGKIKGALADLSEDHKTDAVKNFMELQKKLLPWNQLRAESKYGIPSLDEIDPCVLEREKNNFAELKSQMQDILFTAYPVLQANTQHIGNNLVSLMRYFQAVGVSARHN